MKTFNFDTYKLCLSYNPCDLFTYFNSNYLHGLDYHSCLGYTNTKEDSYISGMNNEIPRHWLWNNGDKQIYNRFTPRYVFINLSRCNNELDTITLIYHELLHQSLYIHDYNMENEEEIISWAEEETKRIYKIVKDELQTNHRIKKNKTIKEPN